MKFSIAATSLLVLSFVVEARDYHLDEVETVKSYLTVEKESRKPVTGTVSNFTADGQRIAYVELKNGIQNGKEIHWYPTGIRRHEASFEDGKQIGAWVFWYPNGSLMAVHSTDSSIVYNEDGTTKEVRIYTSKQKETIEFQKPKS